MTDDKNIKHGEIHTGDHSIAIQGNVTGSNIVAGDNNVVNSNSFNISSAFVPIYRAVDEHPALTPAVKADVKAEIKDVETELQKGEQADDSGVMRHLRNVQRMAPDILDVALAALSNPIAGLGMAAKKIIQKMADEIKAKD